MVPGAGRRLHVILGHGNEGMTGAGAGRWLHVLLGASRAARRAAWQPAGDRSDAAARKLLWRGAAHQPPFGSKEDLNTWK